MYDDEYDENVEFDDYGEDGDYDDYEEEKGYEPQRENIVDFASFRRQQEEVGPARRDDDIDLPIKTYIVF